MYPLLHIITKPFFFQQNVIQKHIFTKPILNKKFIPLPLFTVNTKKNNFFIRIIAIFPFTLRLLFFYPTCGTYKPTLQMM
jgi:hypothetical protein